MRAWCAMASRPNLMAGAAVIPPNRYIDHKALMTRLALAFRSAAGEMKDNMGLAETGRERSAISICVDVLNSIGDVYQEQAESQ